jgi:putative inorganic carbon (HCO3(-)) transporter
MDAPVPLILVALLAAAGLVAPTARGRAAAMAGALLLTPVLLVAHLWDNSAIQSLRDRPALAAVAVVGGLAAVGALAVLFHRRPVLFPLAAVAMVPFRIPIATGGSTANLLVPLYLVLGAGVLAYAVPRLRSDEVPDEAALGWLERALAAAVVLYAVQATYSSDFDHALENVVFFYVPFTLLFALLRRVTWTDRLAAQCLGILAALALVFVGIGFVEYATRSLLLNPKVISSNQFESYFRVNSLFFDPNIYGRFLALVMVGIAGVVLWARRREVLLGGAALLAVVWAGLVLTFSQSSFVALLAGLAILGALRWSVRGAAALSAAAAIVAVAIVVLAPGAIRLDVGNSKSADAATSGRYDLIKGGVDLFTAQPLEGQGSGSFAREYRRTRHSSDQRAASASHTIPVTVAAEQGVVGLALYLALVGLALWRLLRGASRRLARAVVAAAVVALLVHTLTYAAFLEDPLTWVLLGAGAALAAAEPPRRRVRPEPDAAAVAV